MVVNDIDTRLTSHTAFASAKELHIDWHFIRPGRPVQSGHVESFNCRMEGKLLKETLFIALGHACGKGRVPAFGVRNEPGRIAFSIQQCVKQADLSDDAADRWPRCCRAGPARG